MPHDTGCIILRRSCAHGLTLALAVILFSVAASAANVVRPSVEVNPGTVDLAGRDEVRADVLLRNDSDEALQGVRLSEFNNAGVVITWKDSDVTVPPKSTFLWSISIAASPDTLLPGTVQLHVSYRTRTSRTGLQASIVTLNVNDSGPELIEKLASASLETTAGPLTDYRTQAAYLQIMNNSNRKLTAVVGWHGPEFVKVISQGRAEGKVLGNPVSAVEVTIPAHDKVLVPFTLKLEGAIEPGKHKLMFETRFNWLTGNQQHSGTLLIPYEITSNILGESETLQLLGIPSFLLMPGALLLMVIVGLRKLGWKASSGKSGAESPIPFDIKSADFWVLSITLSIFAGFIFYLIKGRTYLSGYSTRDMLQVWAGTVLVGVLSYAAATKACSVIMSRRAMMTPSEEDSPLDALRKLNRTNQGLKLGPVELTLKEHKCSGFLFAEDSQERSTYWVLPQIIVEADPNAPSKLQQDVDEAIVKEETEHLVLLLESGTTVGVLRVYWNDGDGLTKPHMAQRQEITKFGEQREYLVKLMPKG